MKLPDHDARPIIAAIDAALALLPAAMDTPRARVLMLAIALQESAGLHRRQLIKRDGRLVPEGPACGLWQFEQGGGAAGVLRHASSRFWARSLCVDRGVRPLTARVLWASLQTDDVLAAAMARLLLFTDRKPLPDTDNAELARLYYLRVWRPGKPHKATWAGWHALAVQLVEEQCETSS